MTIDEAIQELRWAKEQSPLGGNTVLVLSLTGSELPDVNVDSLALVKDGDGAVVEVQVLHPLLDRFT